MSCALEDARRRKLARPLYLELHAMGLALVASVDAEGEWCLEVEGLRSFSPGPADRIMERICDHERELLWVLYGSWDENLEAIRGELR